MGLQSSSSRHITVSFYPPCTALRCTKGKPEAHRILHPRCHKPNNVQQAQHIYCCCICCYSTAMQGTDLTWWSPFLFLFWRCIPQLDFLQPGCDKETQLLQNLPRAELSAFKIHFLVTISLAATTSVSSDNSSFLQGHIKLLQGRLFYVLFLMPLCTSFMSKKIICHIQFLQHYSDKNQSLRKSLMSEASSKQSNKYCSSQLVFRVLVVLPEISLTPSTLCCQKNFVCWSFSFLPLPFFFFFPSSLFLFLLFPRKWGVNTSEIPSHLYHSTICKWFHSSDNFTCNLIKRPGSLLLLTSKMYKAVLDQSVLVGQIGRGCVWFLWESLSVSNGE